MVRRFLYLARKLQFQDLDVSRGIVCAVLHNLCIKWREEAEEVERLLRSIQVMKMKLLRHKGVNPLFVSFDKASNVMTFFE